MSVCNRCSAAASRARECFTHKELVHILAAIAAMRRHLDANVNAPHEDKEVSSSVTTKILLSMEEGPRTALLRMLREGTGVKITLDSCPHGLQVLQ